MDVDVLVANYIRNFNGTTSSLHIILSKKENSRPVASGPAGVGVRQTQVKPSQIFCTGHYRVIEGRTLVNGSHIS